MLYRQLAVLSNQSLWANALSCLVEVDYAPRAMVESRPNYCSVTLLI